MKYIPTCTNVLFLVGVSSIRLFLWRRLSSASSSSAAMSFWPLTIVLSAMHSFQSCLLDTRSLIRVTQWSISRCHCSGLASCLLLMLMDWAISETRSLTLSSFHCVVKPLFSCQISLVLAAHWLNPTLAFSAQTRTCRGSIGLVLVSATTDFGNQMASHYILDSQWWSLIEWWISKSCYSKEALGVLNLSSRVRQWSCRGEEGVSKVLEIVSQVGS